ncbi:MAG: precorrin-8X methylmutase [Alphaproteobacteria bacterium]|nr:precorrin-8X methylmutase [Alphaproteobacteria bacterium]
MGEIGTPYLRDPNAITRRSFELIRAEADLSRVAPEARGLATRLIHACGMIDLLDDLVFSESAISAGRAALITGAPVLCDVEMVAAGIMRARLPASNRVRCALGEPGVTAEAEGRGMSRSAVAVERWRDDLAGAVVAIGSAPTALFRLIELVTQGWNRPAVIIAMPVGFVGAAESKEALITADLGVPYVTVRGRRGGSALAAAAVNALAREDHL